MNDQYLCQKPRICCACRKHFPVIFSFITQHRVCNQSNTTNLTSRGGTAHLSGAPQFIPGFKCGSRYLIFSCMCRAYQIVVCPFIRFLLDIVLSLFLRITDYDYHFGIFKLFFYEMYDSVVGIKGYINNKSLSHSINTINKSLKIRSP